MQQFNNKSGQIILDSFQTDRYVSFITKMERKTLTMIFNTYKYLIIMFLRALNQAYFIVWHLLKKIIYSCAFFFTERNTCLGTSHVILNVSQNLFEVFGFKIGIQLILFLLYTDINQIKLPKTDGTEFDWYISVCISLKWMELYLVGINLATLFVFITEDIHISAN